MRRITTGSCPAITLMGWAWTVTGLAASARRRAPTARGATPQNGTLWSYMGEQEEVYVCPSDAAGNGRFSYSAVLALTGVPVSALYRGAILTVLDEHDEEKEVHTAMPLLVEEHPLHNIGQDDHREGGFSGRDTLATRHGGGAHVGFADGHVERIRVPAEWYAENLILITPSGKRLDLEKGEYRYGELLGEM